MVPVKVGTDVRLNEVINWWYLSNYSKITVRKLPCYSAINSNHETVSGGIRILIIIRHLANLLAVLIGDRRRDDAGRRNVCNALMVGPKLFLVRYLLYNNGNVRKNAISLMINIKECNEKADAREPVYDNNELVENAGNP